MDSYAALHGTARVLLAEDDDERAVELLFDHLLDGTGADRGFIVVRRGDTFEERVDRRFDSGGPGDGDNSPERRFSRTLVRRAIETRTVIASANLLADERLAGVDSLPDLGSCSILVAPLHHGGEVYAAVYLEDRRRPQGFPEAARRFLKDFAELAGLFVHRALERQALRERSRSLENDLFAQHDFAGIVTRDPAMLELLRTVAQVADSSATVVVRGETGTGKELIARALHVNSGRRAAPFVALHCTALPATILESELFGHARGAFTGADKHREGRIASAHRGTLFLDEVAEIPPELQAKLLRFLQFGEIQRLGSDRTEKVDVRIIAATHQDLRALVQSGRFRQDLYFRLNVLELIIPPLRERRGDIPFLVEHFTKVRYRRPGEPPRWTRAAQELLARHDYPGNVRELDHLVERACLLARGPVLDVDLLPAELRKAADMALADPELEFERLDHGALEAAREAAVANVERRFLDALMRRHAGNVSMAARESGIHRSQLQKLLARYRGDDGD